MKPSACSPAKTIPLQAPATCAIAWQQELPKAPASSQVETDSTLKRSAEISFVQLWNKKNVEKAEPGKVVHGEAQI